MAGNGYQKIPTPTLVGQSPTLQRVLGSLRQATTNDLPVYIEGEPGTGKEFVARSIHAAGPRRSKPFVALDLSVPSRAYFQEETTTMVDQFSLGRGAGTLLLKEPWAQPDLVEDVMKQQSLEENSRARIMLSSGVPSHDPAQAPVFDILDRHEFVRITIPPLRARSSDIPTLARLFLVQAASALGIDPPTLDTSALDCLRRYPWPGNTAELRTVMVRLAGRAPIRTTITRANIEPLLSAHNDQTLLDTYSLDELVKAKLDMFLQRLKGYRIEGLYGEIMSRVERELIRQVLDHTDGNQVQAAKVLGINRNTLRSKIQKLGIKSAR
ncbi:MAG: sigma-54-dependent Fis family transcriptional regulator [Deltaproteobacteria bacterium]|nr:sigma-54-dependent Fis family transcriptional regulator [Deltaproteobacteria bacterium]